MPKYASTSTHGSHRFGRGIGWRWLALATAGFILASCASSAALNESRESAQNTAPTETPGAPESPESKMLTQYLGNDFGRLGVALFLR